MAILASTGKVKFLRVNDAGGYGPPQDFLDAEVIFQLDSAPDKAFGFQLRNDNQRPAHEGMLEVLRVAFNSNATVTTDYDLPPGKHNGRAIRVCLTR